MKFRTLSQKNFGKGFELQTTTPTTAVLLVLYEQNNYKQLEKLYIFIHCTDHCY